MSVLSPSFKTPAMDSEADMRAACRALCAQFPDVLRLRSIAAVGALDAEIGGEKRDSAILTAALTYMLQSGFLLDPDFEIDVVNFEDGRDFLAEDKKYDAVFIAYIIGDFTGGYRAYRYNIFREDSLNDEQKKPPFGLTRSPLHDDLGWNKRVRQAGAKVIFSFGGKGEIGTRTFCSRRKLSWLFNAGPPYQEVLATPDVKLPSPDYRCEVRSNKIIDLPVSALGYVADHAYLVGNREAFSDRTYLGRMARRCAEDPKLGIIKSDQNLLSEWADRKLDEIFRAVPVLEGDDIGL